MSQKENREERKERKVDQTRDIRSWFHKGSITRASGRWVREAVATDLKRTFTHHTKDKDGEPIVETVTELVYAHHGYRPRFDNEKATRKAFFFRGARVWRD